MSARSTRLQVRRSIAPEGTSKLRGNARRALNLCGGNRDFVGGGDCAVIRLSGATPTPGVTSVTCPTVAGQSAQLSLAPPGAKNEEKAPTSVSLSDQGLVQVLEAAVTRLEPGKPYLLALASEPSGAGVLEPLHSFMTNPAGAAVVNTIGPIRQLVRGEDKISRRYLVILPGTPDNHGAAVQVQSE